MNHRAYYEALGMAAWWRRTVVDGLPSYERATSIERCRYWVRLARAIRRNGL